MNNFLLTAKTALLPIWCRNYLPQTLNLFVTARCNARCEFCLYREAVENPTSKSEELTVDEYTRIAQNYGPLHFLSVSGGEPFLRDDLDQICQTFIDRCNVSAIDIPSNFFFTDAMARTMSNLLQRNRKVYFELQLSVDHLGEEHDQTRKVPGLFNRINKTLKALQPLLEKYSNFQIKGNAVYLESNREHLDNIADWFVTEAGCARFNISFPQQLLLPSTDHPDLANALKDYSAIVETLNYKYNSMHRPGVLKAGILAAKRHSRKRIMQAVQGKKDTGAYCDAGKSIVVINQKGEVFPCEPLWSTVGNLRDFEYDVSSILKGDLYKDFEANYLGDGKCNCTWTCAINSSAAMSICELSKIAIDASKIYTLGR